MMRRWHLFWLASSVCALEAGELSPVDLYEIPLREEMKLIAHGATSIDGERTAFTTTRGVVWILENPRTRGKHADFHWRRFASGLRRPQRIQVAPDNGFLVWQYTEVTQLIDGNGDGVADQYIRKKHRGEESEIVEGASHHPFDGFRSWGKPKHTGQYRGQYFGGESGRPGLSRLSVAKDARGTHYTLIPFVRGIRFPIDCMTVLDERTWMIAQSNRHDSNRTRTRFALHRLDWRNNQPFEVLSIMGLEDGFCLTFSDPLMRNTAQGTWAYRIEEVGEETRTLGIVGVELSEDEKVVILRTEKPVAGRLYRVTFDGVWSVHRDPVRIPMARYRFIENEE